MALTLAGVSPPGTEFFYPVANGNTYVTVFSEAGVRYETIDTNNDGIKDAVNPAARSGDEVSLGLFMMLKEGSGMSTASLNWQLWASGVEC